MLVERTFRCSSSGDEPVTPEEALRLIQQGEGQTVEFKKSLSEEDQAIEALSAFANADGGTVLFGVRPDGHVIGVTVGSNTGENLANKVARSLYPQITPRIDTVAIDGQTIIAMTIEKASKGKVIFAGRAFRRSGRTNQQMSWDQVRDKILEGAPDNSEQRDRPRFEVDLDVEYDQGGRFQPVISKATQVSGDKAEVLEWRYRGPRFAMEWQRNTYYFLSWEAVGGGLRRDFDLSQPPQQDAKVRLNEIGFEIRFVWRGQWRHELHRWPITRQELSPPQRVRWDIGDEILPPLYFDEADEGETTA